MKMKVQLIILIALVGCLDAQGTTKPSNQTNEACRKLVDSMAEEKGIYCAGLIRDKVFIITKDDTVFEFPYSNIDEGGNKWNLQDLKGIPLKDKWPSMYNHPNYAPARRISFQCFTFIDATAAYIVIETKRADNVKGVVFDVDNAEVTQQSITWGGKEDVVLLSTNIPLTYYQARRNTYDGSFEIATFKADSPSILDEYFRISKRGDYSSVCKVGGSVYKLVMRPNDDKGCDKLQWSIMMGFVSDKKFYLFTGSSILLFSEELYTKKGSEQDAYVVGSGSLLECGGAVPINKKKYNWIWILITVLIILLIILIIILCIVRRAWRKKKNKKLTSAAVSARSGLSTKRNLSGAQVSGRPSARSGLSTNRNLSGAQMSARNSARSGLGASRANNLTADGSSKKSTASTRSGMVGSKQALSSNAAFSRSNNKSRRSKLSKAAQQSTSANTSGQATNRSYL